MPAIPMKITLRNGNATAVINRQGSKLQQWSVGKNNGIYYNPNTPKRITHPCGPNFGPLSMENPKVKDDKYKLFNQKQNNHIFTLPQHGFLRDSLWDIQGQSEPDGAFKPATVILGLKNQRPDLNKELYSKYPFEFQFYSIYKLSPSALYYRLSFQNLSTDKEAIVDLASHTYHPWEPGMTISGLSGFKYNDQTSWEKQEIKTLRGNDFTEAVDRDWHFQGIDDSANVFILNYKSGKSIFIRLMKEKYDVQLNGVVIWTKPSEGNYLCFEPVAVGRNSLNLGTALKVKPAEMISLSYKLIMEQKK